MNKTIKVIDLFAGPGGLTEGFSNFTKKNKHPFKTSISIEKDPLAHQTLLLRSFFRQFKSAPDEYYQYLSEQISKEELFSKYPQEYKKTCDEAWLAELGSNNFPHDLVVKKIKKQLGSYNDCIVIGGPPCQAYSLVGRSRMSASEDFHKDPRHSLYKEYLKVIAEFVPAVFVMENVKGILSSRLNGELVFNKIKEDLKTPRIAVKGKYASTEKNTTYTMYSLTCDKSPELLTNNDFIIKSEKYGIPQTRHRVILLGVRNDLKVHPRILKPTNIQVCVQEVIRDLPQLRSGLSKKDDSYASWSKEIKKYHKNSKLSPDLIRGSNFLPNEDQPCPIAFSSWYLDARLKGVLNHETRSHIGADLHRYYYYASYAKKHGTSPKLEELPKNLLPNHKNVRRAVKSKSLFNDRFRVQIAYKPASTITSHISKDGHYFIHYAPEQCRSLTVREAARIQTFPDNYKFEGPRTSQYHQVGNAVPPLLAKQMAEIVYEVFSSDTTDDK